MLSQRLKQLRLARGLSLEELSKRIEGMVTKQALSKYEQGSMAPSQRVVNKLAEVLGVKAVYLLSEPVVEIKFVAHRKASGLTKREDERIKSVVRVELEQRFRLQVLSDQLLGPRLPTKPLSISSEEDVEGVAESLRAKWDLGKDPIASVVDVLEDRLVHVLEVEADRKFDGISAIALGERRKVRCAAVVTRRGIAADRQRFTKAHELGHLVLKVPGQVNEEKAAHRFAGAFLAPKDAIRREVGNSRDNIGIEEMLLLKRRYGMSIQALLYRLKDLEIITGGYYRLWCMEVSRNGWRREEPEPLVPEKPRWLRQNVVRALSEKWITRDEAEMMLGEPLAIGAPVSVVGRRAFARLSVEERGNVLEKEAAGMGDYYKNNRPDD